MANAFDHREFIMLGQKIDVSVWWKGGPDYGYNTEININGRNVLMASYGNVWSHNVIEYPLELGTEPFSLWRWFINNVSPIADFPWVLQVDTPVYYLWAFNADGTYETNYNSGGFTKNASFFISLMKPAGSRTYYLLIHDPGQTVAVQDFNPNIQNSIQTRFSEHMLCQQQYLGYHGFDPRLGLQNNDIYAGCCFLCVPNKYYLPDLVGGGILTPPVTSTNYSCLIQNGLIFQQCTYSDDDDDAAAILYNDITGLMTYSTGFGSMRDNIPIALHNAHNATLQGRNGYFPQFDIHAIGNIPEELYCTIYEMVSYFNGTSPGAYKSIPWHDIQTIPMVEYTIETPEEDVDNPEGEGGPTSDPEYKKQDDNQTTKKLPGDNIAPTPGPGGDTSKGSRGGVLATGMAHLYSPNEPQMRYLSTDILWSDNFLVEMKKLFVGDPISSIISLGFVPINLNSWKGSDVELVIGTYETGHPFTPLEKDYIWLNAGTITITEKWASAMDYEPYSMCEAYLPFIGFVKVCLSDIIHPGSNDAGGNQGNTGQIELEYKVNLFTGDCTAFLFGYGVPQTSDEVSKRHLIGQYNGNCMEYIPFTGVNYSNYYQNQVSSLALGVGGMVAGLASGNPMVAGGALASSSMNSFNQPPQVQRSGGASGGASRLQYLTPFIRITNPAQSLALSEPDGELNQKGYKNLQGVASNFYIEALNDCLGFTQVDTIELKGFNATDRELVEIDSLLKQGVFIGTGH